MLTACLTPACPPRVQRLAPARPGVQGHPAPAPAAHRLLLLCQLQQVSATSFFSCQRLHACLPAACCTRLACVRVHWLYVQRSGGGHAVHSMHNMAAALDLPLTSPRLPPAPPTPAVQLWLRATSPAWTSPATSTRQWVRLASAA